MGFVKPVQSHERVEVTVQLQRMFRVRKRDVKLWSLSRNRSRNGFSQALSFIDQSTDIPIWLTIARFPNIRPNDMPLPD